MKPGDLVRITRKYETRTQDFHGLILEHQTIPESPENPLHKIAKIKMLLSSGVLWDFFLFKRDRFEVIS